MTRDQYLALTWSNGCDAMIACTIICSGLAVAHDVLYLWTLAGCSTAMLALALYFHTQLHKRVLAAFDAEKQP